MASIREDMVKSNQIGEFMPTQEQASEMIDATLHLLEYIEAGLAVRHAGLIYLLPLCHEEGSY